MKRNIKEFICYGILIVVVIVIGIGIHSYQSDMEDSNKKQETETKEVIAANNKAYRVNGTTYQKGLGNHFYAEESYAKGRNILIYHSIINCSSLSSEMIRRDYVFEDSLYRTQNSLFCSHCMNDELIDKCEKLLFNK